jgi:glycosyltransferase involved in cell wall biosynthesis
VIKNLDLGGTTKTCQLFCRYLTEYTDHETWLLYKSDSDLTRLPLFQEFMNKPGFHKIMAFNSEDSCNRLIKDLKPDIVHVYRGGVPEYPYASLDYRLVITNVFGFIDPSPLVAKDLFMSNWLMKAASNFLGWPYGAYRSGKNTWAKRFDFVNNPILPPAHGLSLPDYAFRGASIWLGRCGRQDNGIYDSISVKAAFLLRHRGYDIKFLVMSPPPQMIKDMNEYDIPYRVFATSVDEQNLSTFYNSIDIYAHARLDGESFGNNLAENLYHGHPVVTHIAVPSHPGMGVFQAQTEMITEDVGFVVEHNVADYANALQRLIDNPDLRVKMGHAAFEKAKNEFDWRISGAKLNKIYEEILI